MQDQAQTTASGAPVDTSLETMLAEVAAAWDAAITPRQIRQELETFVKDNKGHVDRLTVAVYASAAWWIIKGAEAGHSRDVLDQVAVQTLQSVSASVCLTMKARQGEPFDPARFAIVGYHLACRTRAHDQPADLEGVTRIQDAIEAERLAGVEADNAALRTCITEILDAAHGGDATDADRLVAIRDLCSTETNRWFEGAGPISSDLAQGVPDV